MTELREIRRVLHSVRHEAGGDSREKRPCGEDPEKKGVESGGPFKRQSEGLADASPSQPS